ncbi:Response regulator receiver domain-containing protein [Cnuella takakiae]|uniref:Response regulator receiver domain-containing protein n=1 Tax=Cnuella takakiae TaxID=1302690 RepID=A0A1M5CM89_9BACT|nr:response regulator [Cnuella takakiae]OLY91878.1 hypothetical protein BUE76_08180 [Cnuella takakiae]SHF55874.1 Response regulator receiver domain-containing protein [Cnuella takakiae]
MHKQAQQKPVILWVDDDADDSQLFREAFESHNTRHQLVQVWDAMEALAYLRQQDQDLKPVLIVLDINMPLMNGKELLSELKGNPVYRGIPVVMVSTSNTAEDQEFCERYHVMIMEKPDSEEGIDQMVRQLVNVAL